MHAQAAHRAEQGLQSTSQHPREAGPQLPPRVIISPRALDAAGGADAVVEVGAEGAKEGLDSCGAQGSFAAAAEPAWTVKKGESWLERAQRLQVLSATSRGSPPATHGGIAGTLGVLSSRGSPPATHGAAAGHAVCALQTRHSAS